MNEALALDDRSLIDLEDTKTQRVAQKLNVKETAAMALLVVFSWDEQALLEAYRKDAARTLLMADLDPRLFGNDTSLMANLQRMPTVAAQLRRADSLTRRRAEADGGKELCHM